MEAGTIGTTIGKYRVLQLLGEGGMGRVLLVEHVLMKTRHALKILHDPMSRNEVIALRFINEARAAGAIGHRNVVEVTHVDQVEGGGPWYLVMKYLEGQTLTRYLASRRAPIEQHLIVHILGEALNGLQAAHDRRIIHRDLKPDNLYLTAVKDDPYRTILLDFGVAQLGHDSTVVTRSGAVIGTPRYMAPEQHRAAALDARADIWAMGAIAYEMATRRLPYQGDADPAVTAQEIFHRMMTVPVVDPRHYNPALTEGFASALLQALHPDAAHRTASARALARMLADATPAGPYEPSGRDILERYADELLDEPTATPAGLGPTIGSRDPAVGGSIERGYNDLVPQIAAPRPAPGTSTPGAPASQAFPSVSTPARRSWVMLAAGVISAIVAAGIASLIMWTMRTPRTVSAPGRGERMLHIAQGDGGVPAITVATSAREAAMATPVVDAGTPGAAATETAAAPGPSDLPDRLDARAPSSSIGHGNRGDAHAAEPRARPASGSVHVIVVPWAEVWLDGKPLGQAPVTVRATAGTHRLRLKNDAKERTFTIRVSAGQTTTIESW